MIWIYLSKSADALELKVYKFQSRYSSSEILHLFRPNIEIIRDALVQYRIDREYRYFIFEDYIGDFEELYTLLNEIKFLDYMEILLTKLSEQRLWLKPQLVDLLSDASYWIYFPILQERIEYLDSLIEDKGLALDEKVLSWIRGNSTKSISQIKGLISNISSLVSSGKEISSLSELSFFSLSNDLVWNPDEKYLFLHWYFSGSLSRWYLFLRQLSKFEGEMIGFLHYLSHALTSLYWKHESNLRVREYLSELLYGLFIFLESEIFKIKRGLCWPLIYFFWVHRPSFRFQI